MFQNSTLPSVSVDITRNIAGSLPRVRSWQGLTRLDMLVPLPRTFREYLTWLTMMTGVTILALLQVWAALQISQAQVELTSLRTQSVLIEQENAQLLWEISHYTTLERVEAEATAAGFVPALRRRYVLPETTAAQPPALSSNPAARPEVPVSTHPAAGVNTETAQIAVELSALWDGWPAQWNRLRQNVVSAAAVARAAVAQRWARIDMARLLWIGNTHE